MIIKGNETSVSSSSMNKEDMIHPSLKKQQQQQKQLPSVTITTVTPPPSPCTTTTLTPQKQHKPVANPPPRVEKKQQQPQTNPPKPFFIMDWLENVDSDDLQLAQRMLSTPRKSSKANGEAPSNRAVTIEPKTLFASQEKTLQQATAATTSTTTTASSSKNSIFYRRSVAIGNGYNAKGLSKAQQGKWEDALSCWESALEIRTQVLGSNHLDVANTMNNLGIAYGKVHQPTHALSLLQTALQARSQHYGTTNHTQVAATLHNIGNVLQESDDIDAAVDYFAQARDCYQAALNGPYHVQVARSTLALGHGYYQQGNYEPAHEALCRALQIFEHLAEDTKEEEYAAELEATRLDVQELEEFMYRS